jgi:hypothetical protein
MLCPANAKLESAGSGYGLRVCVFRPTRASEGARRRRARRPTCHLRGLLDAPGAGRGDVLAIPILDVAGLSPVTRSLSPVYDAIIAAQYAAGFYKCRLIGGAG